MKEYIPLLVVYFSLVLLGAGFQTLLFWINSNIASKFQLKDKTQSIITVCVIFSIVWPTFRQNGISQNDTIACLIILVFTGMVFNNVLSFFLLEQKEAVIRDDDY